MKNKILYISLSFFLIVACKQRNGSGNLYGTSDSLHVSYATCFTVEKGRGFTMVKVRNPWDTTKIMHTYILVGKEEKIPLNLQEGTLIRTPLNKVAVYSSVHCGILNALGLVMNIAGVCESRYIDIKFVKEGLKSGKIIDLGEASSPDVEKIIDIKPDAIITTPLENLGYGSVEKIGIPLIESVDYMEVTPLGRAEWIRFFALFFCKEEVADSIFKSTVSSYNNIKEIASKVRSRPTVVPETKNGSVWYIPGGKSYMANFFADAGADYPWKDNLSSGSVPVSFEGVLERGGDADIWMIKYNKSEDLTYEDLKNEYNGYENFSAFKNRTVYTCNTGKVPYYEELSIHPDYVLKDFVWVFHPELMLGYQPRYFKKMER